MPAMSESARTLFAPAIGEAEQTALLLDAAGTPLAGSYIDQNGRDISGEIGAALSGVGREVTKSMRLLGIGRWTAVVVETDAAIIALVSMMSPSDAPTTMAAITPGTCDREATIRLTAFMRAPASS